MYLMENMVMVIFCQNLRICKVSGSIVWCEDASPGAIRGAMTDGLVEVIGVSCELLLSDDVSMGRVSSNGSIPGLVGKISANPNTLRNVTSESTDNSCIIYCLGVQLGLGTVCLGH